MTPRNLHLLLVLSLFACNGDDKDETGDTDQLVDSDTGEPATCGDGIVQEPEDCDFGENNAVDGNCLLDCTLSDTQQWALSLAALPLTAYDAVGVVEPTAPYGTGAWRPADSDLNFDGLPKLQLNLPLYDFRDDPALASVDTTAFPELGQITERDVVGEITVADIAEVRFQA